MIRKTMNPCARYGGAVLLVAALVGVSGTARTPVTSATEPAVCVSIDRRVGEGITAKGCLMISQTLRAPSGDSRVKVIAHSITITVGESNDKTEFMGAPTVDVSSRTPNSSATSTVVRRLDDGTRRFTSIRLEIATRSDKTWGDVQSGDDIDIRVVREVNVR